MLRCGTSVGAHYAEASHAKSIPDFISKCDGARQEMQEFLYWLELIVRSDLVTPSRVQPLEREARGSRNSYHYVVQRKEEVEVVLS